MGGAMILFVLDVPGGIDDDREEIVEAANFACNASCKNLTSCVFFKKIFLGTPFCMFI